MGELGELARLFDRVDRATSLELQINTLRTWIDARPEVTDAAIVCNDSMKLGPADGVIPRVTGHEFDLMPSEIAVVNGKSPIPRQVFENHCDDPVAVYVPFAGGESGPRGALLVKSKSPKAFLRKHRDLLLLLASKTSDVLEVEAQRWMRIPGSADSSITPDVFGRIADAVGLPMYILGSSGSFRTANDSFLSTFDYADIEELNSREVFLSDVDLSFDVDRLTSARTFAPQVVRLRTASGRVRSAFDFSMLIGKEQLGILVDVTDFVLANSRLEQALEGQTTLNEKLSAATEILQKTQATAMKSLARLAEYRDQETGSHLHRICEYMKLLAIELHNTQPFSFHVDAAYPDDIYLSGMLHDIGKVGVPDQILLKPGPLAETEWDIMKQHTTWGHSILNQADVELGEQSFLTLGSTIALHHHEWFNGSGYPHGLSGEDIPLSARIGAIADVYDALTSERPYKEAWAHEAAVAEIVDMRGIQFDPVVTDVFLGLERQFLRVKNRFPD